MMFLKIPRKASLKKMRGYPSFEMSFFQKSDVIWTLGHSPCSVLEAQEFDKVG